MDTLELVLAAASAESELELEPLTERLGATSAVCVCCAPAELMCDGPEESATVAGVGAGAG